MAFKRSDRQRIIDGYLAATGRNHLHPREFIDWLSSQPNHEAYPWFFAKSDTEAAMEYRIDLCRKFVSGLRISVSESIVDENQQVHIVTREYPAMLSPVRDRGLGGGYEPVDPTDTDQLEEIRRQGRSALRAWLRRYRGAFEKAGYTMHDIEQIAEEP